MIFEPEEPSSDPLDDLIAANRKVPFSANGAPALTTGWGPAGRTTANGIPLSQILHDRPDVYAAFFTEFHGPNNDVHSSAWFQRVGGATPEDYANYWYETYGKFGEYSWTPSSGPMSAPIEEAGHGRRTSDGLSIAQLLEDRPDVRDAFYREYYGPNNDPHSSAWMNRVGGATVEDYANYWYETFGKHGEYGPSKPIAEHAAQVGKTITDDGVSLQEILRDRPDVFQAFYTEYYGPNNDQHSSAWLKRVGGETPEAYANYWYEKFGKAAGYVPGSRRPAAAPADEGEQSPASPEPDTPHTGSPDGVGTDALGNPIAPPPEAAEAGADPSGVGVDALGKPIDPPAEAPAYDDVETAFALAPSGDDLGGIFLPAM